MMRNVFCLFSREQGIASHWPFGRGVYISEDGGLVVWVGEQDHLRIICTEETTELNRVFDRLCIGLQTVSALRGVQYAVSDQFGAITSCPVGLPSLFLCYVG